jgi:hypothetical protein
MQQYKFSTLTLGHLARPMAMIIMSTFENIVFSY